MSKHDQQVNLDLAKIIPFSKTNEQLKCYKFPEGDMTYDSIHKLLMALSQYGLKDDLPVSYTHLDVYKRQGKHIPHRLVIRLE